MIINDVSHKTKCDFSGCKNLAETEIKDETDTKKKMVFCKNCLESMLFAYLKTTTPKGVEAPFKKHKKLR